MKLRVCAFLLATAPFTALAQQPSMAKLFMMQMDADKDGKVSLAEFQKPTEAQFRRMDKNSDGFVDDGEAEAFSKIMEQRLEQMRQKAGHGQQR